MSCKNANCETQDFNHVIFKDIAGVFQDHFKVVSFVTEKEYIQVAILI